MPVFRYESAYLLKHKNESSQMTAVMKASAPVLDYAEHGSSASEHQESCMAGRTSDFETGLVSQLHHLKPNKSNKKAPGGRRVFYSSISILYVSNQVWIWARCAMSCGPFINWPYHGTLKDAPSVSIS